MTPQEINTIMRALGRMEGTVGGLSDRVETQAGQLATLLDAAAETRGAVEQSTRSKRSIAAWLGLAVALVSAGAGVASYIASAAAHG